MGHAFLCARTAVFDALAEAPQARADRSGREPELVADLDVGHAGCGHGAKAVYAFYAGAPAIAFVKQYQQFGIGLPLYAPAFLTEGAALAAAGPAATGITTIATYDPTLPSPGNAEFVTASKAANGGATPNLYVETMYAAGSLLDKAVAGAGANATSESINAAISKIGSACANAVRLLSSHRTSCVSIFSLGRLIRTPGCW
ncbi:ABC transporter substrate-binding protein [Dactylosporangium sp. NPDC051484]|uniref:ABC transporter substrate-binding protein n=1 Tax=Dactylosporangium sp. NPDC051484 TaxID=3154942 RepID=UPI00344FB591